MTNDTFLESCMASARAKLAVLRNRYEDRMGICLKCPRYEPKFAIGMNYSTCGACGCVLQAKARIPEAKCPEDRWAQP